MRRILRWAGYLVIVLASLVLLAITAIYGVSAYKLNKTHEVPEITLSVPAGPAAVSEGERLARIRGCFKGCHADLDGNVMMDGFWFGRIVAPNLTEAASRYSAEDLARIVRYGVRPDGSTTTGMPSDMFYFLSDADLARIIAFLKSAEAKASELPDTRYGLLARVALTIGEYEPDAARVAALAPRPPVPTPGPTPAYGRYLAMTSCTECHGMRLEGQPFFPSPPLAVAKAYSREEFGRLMTEGQALGDRELGVMGDVARGRFSVFTEKELDALYAFLQSATIPLEEGPAVADAGGSRSDSRNP